MRVPRSTKNTSRVSSLLYKRFFRHPFFRAVSKRLDFRLSLNSIILVIFFLFLMTFGPYLYFEYHLNKAMKLEKIKDQSNQLDSTPKVPEPFIDSSICKYLKSRPMVCAHGGDVEKAPPNTIASYELAIQANVDCVEIDVSRTMDGILVVLHDRDLQTFSEVPNLRVGNLNFAEILAMDAGKNKNQKFKGLKVLTFLSALKILKNRVNQIIVDIKIGPPKFEVDLVSDILSIISEVNCFNCILWSKSDSIIHKIKELHSNTKAGIIVMQSSEHPYMSDYLRINNTEVLAIYHKLINKNMMVEIHKIRKSVYAWTVDDLVAMQEMIEMKVDSIVSNRPRLLQFTITKYKKACINNGYKIH